MYACVYRAGTPGSIKDLNRWENGIRSLLLINTDYTRPVGMIQYLVLVFIMVITAAWILAIRNRAATIPLGISSFVGQPCVQINVSPSSCSRYVVILNREEINGNYLSNSSLSCGIVTSTNFFLRSLSFFSWTHLDFRRDYTNWSSAGWTSFFRQPSRLGRSVTGDGMCGVGSQMPPWLFIHTRCGHLTRKISTTCK